MLALGLFAEVKNVEVPPIHLHTKAGSVMLTSTKQTRQVCNRVPSPLGPLLQLSYEKLSALKEYTSS